MLRFPATPRERAALDALLNDTSIRARRRARIVLGFLDGQDDKSIAALLGTRAARVRLVLASFEERRLGSFSGAALKRVSYLADETPVIEPTVSDLPVTMLEAGRRILFHQFSKLDKVEGEVRLGEDPEAIHDMRVASRRLNSAFRLLRSYLPNKPLKKLRSTMEQLRDLLGEARNFDVLLDDLAKYRASAATGTVHDLSLDTLTADWTRQRAEYQQELVTLLDSPDYQRWKMGMEDFLTALLDERSPHISDVLPALIWKQYGTVRVYQGHLHDATLEELHQLRIDIKRLRYTLEFFRESLDAGADGALSDALVQPLVALQDHLGLMQDAVVAGHALTDFITAQAKAAKKHGEGAPEFQAVAAYHSELQNRITALRETLPSKWAEITSPNFRRRLALATAAL